MKPLLRPRPPPYKFEEEGGKERREEEGEEKYPTWSSILPPLHMFFLPSFDYVS
jgi:hypothetical protein